MEDFFISTLPYWLDVLSAHFEPEVIHEPQHISVWPDLQGSPSCSGSFTPNSQLHVYFLNLTFSAASGRSWFLWTLLANIVFNLFLFGIWKFDQLDYSSSKSLKTGEPRFPMGHSPGPQEWPFKQLHVCQLHSRDPRPWWRASHPGGLLTIQMSGAGPENLCFFKVP